MRKRLTLRRLWFEDERTLGELYHGREWIAYTMEPGMEDAHERVPASFYALVRHDEPRFRFRDTWALEGRNVFHSADDPAFDGTNPDHRSAILFHSGNRDEDTQGCILLGMRIGRFKEETAVLESGAAMRRLRGVLGADDAYLTIEEV